MVEKVKCSDCNGRGQWTEENTDRAGMVTVTACYCETCKGNGFVDGDAADYFDIGGEGDDDN